MSGVLSYCILGIAAAMLAAYLQPTRPDFSLVLILSAGAVIFLVAIRWLRPVLDTLAQLAGTADATAYLSLLLKALGICLIGKFASDFCKDAGHAALSGKIDLMSRCAVLLMGLPLIENIVEILKQLIG